MALRLVARRPLVRAGFFFTMRVLARSVQNRLSIGIPLAIAIAVAMVSLPAAGMTSVVGLLECAGCRAGGSDVVCHRARHRLSSFRSACRRTCGPDGCSISYDPRQSGRVSDGRQASRCRQAGAAGAAGTYCRFTCWRSGDTVAIGAFRLRAAQRARARARRRCWDIAGCHLPPATCPRPGSRPTGASTFSSAWLSVYTVAWMEHLALRTHARHRCPLRRHRGQLAAIRAIDTWQRRDSSRSRARRARRPAYAAPWSHGISRGPRGAPSRGPVDSREENVTLVSFLPVTG